MDLRVVGAGGGRTGTASLKIALERLLGKPCYHMLEVFAHPEHVPLWHRAALGEMPDWHAMLSGYAASVDWPAAGFWPELMKAFPDALVLLSVRDPGDWWQSASETIFRVNDNPFVTPEWKAMIQALFAHRGGGSAFPPGRDDAIRGFEAHNERVMREVAAERLLVWRAGDGWAPICKALGTGIPPEPFPRINTREEWRAREGKRLDPKEILRATRN